MSEIIITDKDSNDQSLFIDYEQWQFNSDWYEWAEIYMYLDKARLPLEHQFDTWRKRVKNR
jgi:hypothetical protein